VARRRQPEFRDVDGRLDLFVPVQLGRAQLPQRFGFQGWVAFNPGSSLPANEPFFVAVHELGHVFGLPQFECVVDYVLPERDGHFSLDRPISERWPLAISCV
jgi:hypothetical protein